MTEKWYYSKLLRDVGRKPAINAQASVIRNCLWLNLIISSIAVSRARGALIAGIIIIFFIQLFFLQLIYLWVKYEAGFHKFWILKNENPTIYRFNIMALTIIYVLLTVFPIWAVLE